MLFICPERAVSTAQGQRLNNSLQISFQNQNYLSNIGNTFFVFTSETAGQRFLYFLIHPLKP